MNQTGGFKVTAVIVVSFLASLILTIIPLPGDLVGLRPAWALIVLFFWLIVAPHRVNVISAWFVGLLIDLLTGGTLGLHALLYTLLAFSVLKLHSLMRGLAVAQKLLLVTLAQFLVMLAQCLVLRIQQTASLGWYYWMPLLSTALFWVWGQALLERIQLRYKIGY